MQRTVLIALVLATVLGPVATTGPAQARDKVGLVLAEQYDRTLDDMALNAATDAFLASRRFTVLERDALDDVMQEKSLKGFIGDAQGAEIGEILGLRWMAMLNYTKERNPIPGGGIQESYELTTRMVDVASGQVMHTLTSRPGANTLEDRFENKLKGWFEDKLEGEGVGGLTATYDPTIPGAGRRLLQQILLAFPPEGYLIEFVSRNEVVVDLGIDDGLNKGDYLEVFSVGEPSLHPITGAQLPGREIVQGELKVLDVRAGMSTCKIKEGRDALAVGSRVRFRPREGLMNRFSIGR